MKNVDFLKKCSEIRRDLLPHTSRDDLGEIIEFLQKQRLHYMREAIYHAVVNPSASRPVGNLMVVEILVSKNFYGHGKSLYDTLCDQYAQKIISEGVFAKNFTLIKEETFDENVERFLLYFQT